jgi:thiosulfate dehydrogenase [quinone] large subunit
LSSLRSIALVVGTVAAVLLFWMVNPWVEVPSGIDGLVTIAFWAAAIALVLVLFLDARRDPKADEVEVEGPAFARFLFNNSRAGLFWLPIRLFIGFAWLEAGWHKATGTGWLDGGSALAGFWKAAAAVPQQGRPPITYEWYRDFINTLLTGHHETWFAPLIVAGEIAVGLGLIFGVLTGLAAFFGAFMNMTFLLAGSASTNPIMFTFAVDTVVAGHLPGLEGGRLLRCRPVAAAATRDPLAAGSDPPAGRACGAGAGRAGLIVLGGRR